MPDYDPAKDGIFERQMVAGTRETLHDTLLKLDLREEEVARLRERNAHLESELKLQERHLTNAPKDNIVLKQKLALKPAGRRWWAESLDRSGDKLCGSSGDATFCAQRPVSTQSSPSASGGITPDMG